MVHLETKPLISFRDLWNPSFHVSCQLNKQTFEPFVAAGAISAASDTTFTSAATFKPLSEQRDRTIIISILISASPLYARGGGKSCRRAKGLIWRLRLHSADKGCGMGVANNSANGAPCTLSECAAEAKFQRAPFHICIPLSNNALAIAKYLNAQQTNRHLITLISHRCNPTRICFSNLFICKSK